MTPQSDLLQAALNEIFPEYKIVLIVERRGHFQLIGLNCTTAHDKVGLIETARIAARMEFANQCGAQLPEVVQSEMKTNT